MVQHEPGVGVQCPEDPRQRLSQSIFSKAVPAVPSNWQSRLGSCRCSQIQGSGCYQTVLPGCWSPLRTQIPVLQGHSQQPHQVAACGTGQTLIGHRAVASTPAMVTSGREAVVWDSADGTSW